MHRDMPNYVVIDFVLKKIFICVERQLEAATNFLNWNKNFHILSTQAILYLCTYSLNNKVSYWQMQVLKFSSI